MKTRLQKTNFILSTLTFLAGTLAPPALAQENAVTFEEALKASKVLASLRLRYEGASFDNITENANAVTYRARVGFETGMWADTKLLVDFDHVQSIVSDFNSTLNGKTNFPVIADPDVTELNRLQLSNTSLPDTTITLGRQRIIQDDARFVGNVGWRQNEQTYDAIRVINKSIENLTLDASYVDQVNRIFGDDSPMGRFKSNSWLLNAGYKVPIKGANLKVSTYAYLLDFSNAGLSSQTYGGTLNYKRGPIGFKAGYASQSDYGNQPVDYTADRYVLEASASHNGLNGQIGYEVLSGDGQKAFSTPLATLHKFNGFADVFLSTPAAGLEDFYFKAGYKTKSIGILPYINSFIVFHDYKSNFGHIKYGSEIDAVVATKIGKTGLLFKYANYNANAFATDRTRYSVQLDYNF